MLASLDTFTARCSPLDSYKSASISRREPKFFYGWHIVAVGFLAQVNCAFHMSSTLSMANVGIAGLNLHMFAYVTDVGFSTITAATTLTIIASTQPGSTLIWGLVSELMEIRHSSMVMFLVQAVGLALAITTAHSAVLYSGFFLYGIGLGGSLVLPELIWANFFGRLSLGTVRGLGILVTYSFGAAGAPAFGFVHDVTGSYRSSFVAFVVALVLSALLSIAVRAPQKSAV